MCIHIVVSDMSYDTASHHHVSDYTMTRYHAEVVAIHTVNRRAENL